eukprot:6176418-Pleurochrysis_carterae.AAC.2
MSLMFMSKRCRRQPALAVRVNVRAHVLARCTGRARARLRTAAAGSERTGRPERVCVSRGSGDEFARE